MRQNVTTHTNINALILAVILFLTHYSESYRCSPLSWDQTLEMVFMWLSRISGVDRNALECNEWIQWVPDNSTWMQPLSSPAPTLYTSDNVFICLPAESLLLLLILSHRRRKICIVTRISIREKVVGCYAGTFNFYLAI